MEDLFHFHRSNPDLPEPEPDLATITKHIHGQHDATDSAADAFTSYLDANHADRSFQLYLPSRVQSAAWLHDKLKAVRPGHHIGYFAKAQIVSIVFALETSPTCTTSFIRVSFFTVSSCCEVVTKASHVQRRYPTLSVTATMTSITLQWVQRILELGLNELPCAGAQRSKGGEDHHETREVQDASPAIEYLVSTLGDIHVSEDYADTFTKTIHDHVRYEGGELPHRRDASWLAFKVMTRYVYGDRREDYKRLMWDFLRHELSLHANSMPEEHQFEACQKLCRRSKKIGVPSPPECAGVIDGLCKEWKQTCDAEHDLRPLAVLDDVSDILNIPQLQAHVAALPTVPVDGVPPPAIEMSDAALLSGCVMVVCDQVVSRTPVDAGTLQPDSQKWLEFVRGDAHAYSCLVLVWAAA